MTTEHVPDWVASQPLSASDVDCATAVMLKILDGKCKMGAVEKLVMAALYDALRGRQGQRFGADEHALIATARRYADDGMRALIYERRVLAETAISRPVMKAFKAMIRANGLFSGLDEASGDAD